MDLYDRLDNDIKSAMKARCVAVLSTLRLVMSSVKTAEIDKKVKRLEEKDVIQILQKQAKQRRESMAQFEKGGRKDLFEKEAEELAILESYLPKRLSENELAQMVREAMAATGAATKADSGKVIKYVMEKAAGKADGKSVSQAVSAILK